MPSTSSQELLPLLLGRGRGGSGGMLPPSCCAVKGKRAAGAAAATWWCLGQTFRNTICFYGGVPQQASVLEIFTELFGINFPDKSIQW